MAKASTSKRSPFPKWDDPTEYPVRFKGKDIGSVYMRFNPRKSSKGRPCDEELLNEIAEQYHLHLQNEFLAMTIRLEKEMEIYIERFDEVSESNARHLSRRELLDYLLSRERASDFTPFSGYLYSNDAAFYGLLESEGPEILANSGALWRIRSAQWEKNAPALNKIAASLIAGFCSTKRLRKPGPHPRLLDKRHVRLLYDYLLLRMQWVRKLKDWRKVDQKEIVFLAAVKDRVNHWKKLDQGWAVFPNDPEMKGTYLNAVDRAAKAIIEDRKPGFSNPIKRVAQWIGKRSGYNDQIRKCIASSKDLQGRFKKFDWPPNEMAKEICCRLLDISENRLFETLWRNKESEELKGETKRTQPQ